MELPSEFAIPTAPAGIGDSIFEETPVPTQLETAEFRRTLGMFATGVTVEAIAEQLVERLGGVVVGCCFIIELGFLNGREKLSKYDLHALIEY